MSREKFEAWAYEIENFCMRMDRLLDQFGTDGAMHQAWLAGRESMRDEAAKSCEEKANKIHPDGKKSNQVDRHVADVLDRHADEIRKIEL